MTHQKRSEKDSMGSVDVPAEALWGAQTQRAIENFRIGDRRMPSELIHALASIKQVCAQVNGELGVLDSERMGAIVEAAQEVMDGRHHDQFPVSIYQTGSGTSTNMNMNEVLARRSMMILESRGQPPLAIHPNDHVNSGQSSNDTIPTAIQLAALRQTTTRLCPSARRLINALERKASQSASVLKSGRTHLMDALPISAGEEIGAWKTQLERRLESLEGALDELWELPLGGGAVGTGFGRHPQLAPRVIKRLGERYQAPLREARNPMEANASRDGLAQFSGALRTLAIALTKIADDLRWLSSGPRNGLGELSLPALQPGSSIMPGKVNPVIPEAVLQVAARVLGNDATIAWACARGAMQLNTMMPIMAHALLESIQLLSDAMTALCDHCVEGMKVDDARCRDTLERNLMLATALASEIGYDAAAEIAHEAWQTNRNVREVARQRSGLSDAQLDPLLDPSKMVLKHHGK